MRERSNNPILSTKAFDVVQGTQLDGVMTLNGVIAKTFLLLSLVIISAYYAWSHFVGLPDVNFVPYLLGSVVGGLVLVLAISFKPDLAPFISPVYAVVEGIFLGITSMFFEQLYPGIVMQAIGGTLSVFLVMLSLYRTNIIKVNDRFRTIVISATLGIVFFYIVSMALRWIFHIEIPLIYDSGWVGIGFSLFVIVIASLNLALDFDFISSNIERGASKNREWYGAFALLVTIIWLYVEILRLLSKLRD